MRMAKTTQRSKLEYYENCTHCDTSSVTARSIVHPELLTVPCCKFLISMSSTLLLHTKFQVDSQTSVHFPPKNGSVFFTFADASPVCAEALASMSEIFSGVWYVEKRMMKYIKYRQLKKKKHSVIGM